MVLFGLILDINQKYAMVVMNQSMSFDNTTIVTVKRHDYRVNICFMTKSEAVDEMKKGKKLI